MQPTFVFAALLAIATIANGQTGMPSEITVAPAQVPTEAVTVLEVPTMAPAAPEPTAMAPEPTTMAPEPTTMAPEPTTMAPEAPETEEPEVITLPPKPEVEVTEAAVVVESTSASSRPDITSSTDNTMSSGNSTSLEDLFESSSNSTLTDGASSGSMYFVAPIVVLALIN